MNREGKIKETLSVFGAVDVPPKLLFDLGISVVKTGKVALDSNRDCSEKNPKWGF
jgi:hypothetical protein